MKQLIINADDFGADEGRNEGILAALSAGTVTSVSVLANGGAVFQALEGLRNCAGKTPSVGIHLNLSEGYPLSGSARMLTGAGERFQGRAAAYALLERPCAVLKREVDREIAAQIELLRREGFPPTHLDGHQHIHLFPAVLPSVLEASRAFGIPWLRIPCEDPPECAGDGAPAMDAVRFHRLGLDARKSVIDGIPLQTDHFRGLYLKGRLTLPLLLGTLETLPAGLTELMVHPGKRLPQRSNTDAFSPFATEDRERELAALLSPVFLEALRDQAVILTSFSEALP